MIRNEIGLLAKSSRTVVNAIVTMAWLLASMVLPGTAFGQDSRGEIRLHAPLSGLPNQLAIGPDGQFAVVSGRDGVVTQFDLQIQDRADLYYSPVRKEEGDRRRPVAISPSGDLIAVGAPDEVGVPASARIYFFAQGNPRRTLFTIEHLPAHPTALRFLSDRGGGRLRLVVGFANGRPPSIWDVSPLAEVSPDPDRVVRVGSETPLPEPRPGFFADCGRTECSTLVIAAPPGPISTIGLLVGSDSGLVLYDGDLNVVAYGAPSNGRPDLRRVSSISFSDDGHRFAIGKLRMRPNETPPNRSCQVDVYDLSAFHPSNRADQPFTLVPQVLAPPPSSAPSRGMQVVDASCSLPKVAWSGDAIFAAGVYWHVFDSPEECRTRKDLNERFDPEANAMVRFAMTGEPGIDLICVGTSPIVDVQPVPGGGVAVATHDPLFAVYDADGKQSRYPGHIEARRAEGIMLDLRGAAIGNDLLGDFSVDDEGGVVLLRPFLPTKTYVAIDLKTTGMDEPLVVETRQGAAEAKAKLIRTLARRRGVENIDLAPRASFPQQCLGLQLAADETLEKLIDDLNGTAHGRLPLRPLEAVHDIEFLPPSERDHSVDWRVAIGTSHRLLFLDCEGHDLWHGGRLIEDIRTAGTPIRDDAYQIRVSGNRRFLIAVHGDGVLRWYDLASGREIWCFFIDHDLRSWVAWTADGHFDSSQDLASWSAGWLKSTGLGNGVWSLAVEPLAKYEEWREPNVLRNRITAKVINTAMARVAPDQGDPTVQIDKVTIAGGEQASAIVSLRVENFSEGREQLENNIEFKVDRMGTVMPIRFDVQSKDQSVLVQAELPLSECLRRNGLTFRVSVRVKGRNSHDLKAVKYPGATSAAPCMMPRVFGVFVGIDKYDKLPTLQYADQDARKFYEFWSNGSEERSQTYYDVGQLLLITVAADGTAHKVTRSGQTEVDVPIKADRETIRRALNEELDAIDDSRPKASDIVILYLSGHGVARQDAGQESWFFMAPDGDRDHLEETAFSAEELRDKIVAFDRPGSGAKVLVFVDACRNSEVTYGSNPQRGLISDLFDFADNRLMGTVFLATMPDSSSYEFPESDFSRPSHPDTCEPSQRELHGGGAFTEVLLDLFGAAVGEQKIIDISEIQHALREGVGKVCRKQQPAVGKNPNDYHTNLVLAR